MLRGLTKCLNRSGMKGGSLRNGLMSLSRANMNHVPNMLDENLKYDAQKYNDDVSVL